MDSVKCNENVNKTKLNNFYREVEIGIKLHDILAAISQLHSFKITVHLYILWFGCFNLMVPKLAFDAAGGRWF